MAAPAASPQPAGPARGPLATGIALLAALVFLGLSALMLWGQSIYSLSGVPATGKVVEFHAMSARSQSVEAEVDVALPGAAPFRWEVEDTFRLMHWEEGASVPLLCAHVHADHWSCVIDSLVDRFLFPACTLAVGIAALLLALRRPRAAAA